MRRSISLAILLTAIAAWAHATPTPQLVLISQQATVDTDGDGVVDIFDNAPGAVNADQTDTDADAIGDAIDPTPSMSNPFFGDPFLGIYSAPPIPVGGTAAFDYSVMNITPPGSWGRVFLDFDADMLTDAVYFGPLTAGISTLNIPANFYVGPLWNLNAPGTYTVAMKAFGPAVQSANWAYPNVTVLPAPEPATIGLATLSAVAALAYRRRRPYR